MAEVTFRELTAGLRRLGLSKDSHVVAHVSLSSFGRVRGGATAVAAALTHVCGTVIMPAFTYQTMVIPPVGPPDNGITYGERNEQNQMSEFWHLDLPVHRTIGAVAEALRSHPEAWRSDHPVLSFIGVGRLARDVINAQLLTDPLAPLDVLMSRGGDLLLLGVGLTRATVVHLAERRAGRRTFTRWALTTQTALARPQPGERQARTRPLSPGGVARTSIREVLLHPPDTRATSVCEIPEFPGCSDGFDQLAPHIADIGEGRSIGQAQCWRYPLAGVVATAVSLIREDPAALLCSDPGCERCNAVRAAAASPIPAPA